MAQKDDDDYGPEPIRHPGRETLVMLGLVAGVFLFVWSVSAFVNQSETTCQPERVVNLLPHWADEIEREYNRTYEFEIMVRDDLHHIDSWGDANVGDIFFEVIDEMRVYANECSVND